MQRVKIFKSVESELTELEAQVNEWIQETGATIIGITGNIAPQSTSGETKAIGLGGSAFAASDVMLVILYEPAGE